MKKIVWGGFCLLAGILLFWMFESIPIMSSIPNFIAQLLSSALGIYGLIIGFIGLRKD